LRKLNSRLQGHPHNLSLPGLETTSGPLSQGVSQAVGMALALKMDRQPNHVYLIMSDGEHEEGQTWEGIMLAGKNHLNNLTGILDRNKIQIDGNTEEIMPLEDLAAKYKAFNWHVLEIDGNKMQEIISAYEKAKTIKDRPTLIMAHTLAGKGVKYMEGNYIWHGAPPGIANVAGAPPKEQQVEVALQDLRAAREKIDKEK
jgi:transketolase